MDAFDVHSCEVRTLSIPAVRGGAFRRDWPKKLKQGVFDFVARRETFSNVKFYSSTTVFPAVLPVPLTFADQTVNCDLLPDDPDCICRDDYIRVE